MTDPTRHRDDVTIGGEVAPTMLAGPIDRRRFMKGVGALAGATAVGALTSAVAFEVASAAAGLPSRFVALPVVKRVADTRRPGEHVVTRLNDRWIRIQLGGAAPKLGIPNNASAVVGTLTAVNWLEPNHVAAFPSAGVVPLVSQLNLNTPGAVNANLVTVRLKEGWIDIASLVPCDVIFDVIGFYEPVVGGAAKSGRYVPLAAARRAVDTRFSGMVPSGGNVLVDLTNFGVPQHASVASINLTATECTGPGHFTVYPATESKPPNASSLNVSEFGETRASAVLAPVTTIGGRRYIKIFVYTAAHLIVDVNGYFTSESSALSASGLFVPVDPVRIVDSRDPGHPQGRLWPQWSTEVAVPAVHVPANAAAVVTNVTGTQSRGPGYLTVSAARTPRPESSNVNFFRGGATVPNHVITPITAGCGFDIFSSHGAHVLADLFGYFTGTPQRAVYAPSWQYNPPPPPAPPPYLVQVPRIGLAGWAHQGDAHQVTNSGNLWYWEGTGWLGQASNVAAFAHRTEHGGAFRYLDWLQPGDLFTATTAESPPREYTFRMVRRDLTDAQTANILAATRSAGAPTFSLIACTVGYDRSKSAYPNIWAPTSTKYRIVVTAELVSWRELW